MPASAYDDALIALYRAPFDSFVAERKRLSAELKRAGDALGAAALARLGRPSISAWAVNQLWWHERKAFDTLFKTAERLRDVEMDVAAKGAHRDAIAKLRTLAVELLTDAGKPASEATLRRVTTNLSALAAAGGFEPDPPGALKHDRDPPGFEVAGLMASPPAKRKPEKPAAKREPADEKRRQKAEAAAERRRVEQEHAKKQTARQRLERKLRIAKDELETRSEELERLKDKVSTAEDAVEESRTAVQELEAQIAELDVR